MAAAAGNDKLAKMEDKETTAQKLLIGMTLMFMAVTMCVPTRAPMVMQIKKGDVAATAKAMGLMSTGAALIELVVNPILGKLSDQHGRKPFMIIAPMVNTILHSLVAAFPSSLSMQFIDRMISGSMIFGFLAPAQAAMADLFGKDPQKLGEWGARAGMYLGVGTTVGPFIGSKLGGAKSFFASGLLFLFSALFIKAAVPETLALDNRKEFKLSDVNPVAFLKLFKNKTLGMLAACAALQSFGDYVNIYDINNLFMIKVLGYDQPQIGRFAMTVGMTQIAGGKISTEVVKQAGLNVAALFGNAMWAMGMSAMGTARSSAQAFFALFLWTFGHQRGTPISSYMQKYGGQEGMGRGEIIAASGNLTAWVKIFIPLFYSNVFAWATSNGRDMPGLPYFIISFLTGLSQVTFNLANPSV